MDRLIYALAAQALEPGDALALRQAEARPGTAARIRHAAQALGDEVVGYGPWLFQDRGRFMLGELHLDAGAWRGGDRLPILLDGDLPGRARLGVTVHTRAGSRVLSPVEETWILLGALRRTDAGAWALDLVLEDIPGLHRVEVRVLSEADGDLLARAEVGVRVGEAEVEAEG